MPRLRIPVPGGIVTLGVGASGGTYVDAGRRDSTYSFNRATATAMWLNAELGAEARLTKRLAAGFAFGVGHVVAHGEVRNLDGNPTELTPRTLPYTAIKIAYGF